MTLFDSTRCLHRVWLALALLGLLLPAGVSFAGPQIQHWQTGNGARVYFVAAPELPMVDVRVVFDAGSARDGKNAGLSYMTNGLLEEGAGELDADAIAGTFEGLGARFGAESMRDMALASLRSLTEPSLLGPALETFALVLNDPTFPADAFDRERKRLQVALRRQQQQPGDVADIAFYENVFEGHPYATQPEGTEASLDALTREAIVEFHRRYYVGKNAVVAIVGALSRAQAEAVAEQVVGKLPAGSAAAELVPTPRLESGREIVMEHPSTQTHLLVGQPGMHRGDPDYFALYVGNHALGGSGLVSLLSEEIREKRGLSYSVYSYFLPMRVDGPFIMGLQTRNDQADEALGVLREMIAAYVESGPTQEQLEASKKNITGGFALRIDSNKKIVQYLAMIGFYGLPLDYLETFIARVEAVTREDIRDAFARRVHPERMVTVRVGANGAEPSQQTAGSAR